MNIFQKISGHFQKKKQSKKTFWLFLLLILGSFSVALVYLAPALFAQKIERIVPEKNLLAYAHFSEISCPDDFPKCAEWNLLFRKLFLEDAKTIASFSDEAAFAIHKRPASLDESNSHTAFFRIRDRGAGENFLKNYPGGATASEEKHGDLSVFVFSDPIPGIVFFWEGWLVISDDLQFWEKMDTDVRGGKTIAINAEYQRSQKTLSTITAPLFLWGKNDFFREKTPPSILPFLNLAPFVAAKITGKDDTIVASIFTPSLSKSPQTAQYDTLLAALPERDFSFLIGVSAVPQKMEFVFSLLENIDPALSFSVRSFLNEMMNRFFGKKLSVKRDIFPLLENEVVFAMGYAGEWAMAIRVKDTLFANAKKEKMIAGLREVTAKFVPRKKKYTLADGTEIFEIAPCENCLRVKEEKDTISFSAKTEKGEDFFLAIGQKNDLLLMSNTNGWADDFFNNTNSISAKQKGDFITMHKLPFPFSENFSELHLSQKDDLLELVAR